MQKLRPKGTRSGACACGCAEQPSASRDGSAAANQPLHAVGVDVPLKEANLKQLRRIEGQIRGIAAMVEDDRYCADIIHQVSAARQSLHTVARNLMRNHLKHCVAAAMAQEGTERERMTEELLALVALVAR